MDADARFGRIYHNDPNLTTAVRTNYLQLPADVLSHSGTSKEMTIGFWVNMKGAKDFYYSPLFTAYPNVEKASDDSEPWPIFTCLARKIVSLNCWGYCDLGNTYNNNGTNAETSAWLDDKAWHYYTITLTSTTVKVYIDGVVENSWTVDGTTPGQVITGLFDAGAAYTTENGLKYICLGGNQSNNFSDPDPAFGFDDFAVYNAALSAEQIAQVISNKLHYTVNAVDGNSSIFKVLADANSISNSVSVAYPRYILDGTTLREAAATSSNYTKTYTLTSSCQTENIAYTNSTVSNVYYYAEGEDVLTDNRTLTNQSLSMNKIGFTTNSSTYVKVTTLPAGTWTITARYYCANKTGAHNGYIKVGDAVIWSQEYADKKGGNSEKTSDSFTITQPTAMYVAADGGNGTGFDWFYVSGTPYNTIVGQPDCSVNYLDAMTEKVTLTPGQSWHYKFVNHNSNGTDNSKNYIVPVYDSEENKKVVIRADFWDDIKWANTGFTLTSDAGKNVWDAFIANMNGAIVDMTLSYSSENVFTMSSVINTSDEDTWRYSYNSSTAGVTLTGDIKVALSVSLSWLEVLESYPTVVPVTLGTNGYTTFASPYALDLTKANLPSDLKAYKAQSISSTSIHFEEFDQTVPANTGILFEGTASETYNIPVVASGDVVSENLFSVNEDNGYIDPSYDEGSTEIYYFAMIKDSDPLTFGKFNPASYKYPSNKAYLTVAKNAGARLTVSFGEDEEAPTAINAIEAADAKAEGLKDGKFFEKGRIVIMKNGVKFNANGQILK